MSSGVSTNDAHIKQLRARTSSSETATRRSATRSSSSRFLVVSDSTMDSNACAAVVAMWEKCASRAGRGAPVPRPSMRHAKRPTPTYLRGLHHLVQLLQLLLLDGPPLAQLPRLPLRPLHLRHLPLKVALPAQQLRLLVCRQLLQPLQRRAQPPVLLGQRRHVGPALVGPAKGGRGRRGGRVLQLELGRLQLQGQLLGALLLPCWLWTCTRRHIR